MFGDIEIEKWKFRRYKNQIFKKDVDIDNILISNKISSGDKNTLLVTWMIIMNLSYYS